MHLFYVDALMKSCQFIRQRDRLYSINFCVWWPRTLFLHEETNRKLICVLSISKELLSPPLIEEGEVCQTMWLKVRHPNCPYSQCSMNKTHVVDVVELKTRFLAEKGEQIDALISFKYQIDFLMSIFDIENIINLSLQQTPSSLTRGKFDYCNNGNNECV